MIFLIKIWLYSKFKFLFNEFKYFNCIAGYYNRLHAFTFIQLTITLTDKGIKEYERVTEIVFAMIKILQTEPFAYHAYEEYKNKGKIDWDLYQKFDPLEFCKSYSNSMYLYKPETMKNIIKDGYIHKELQIDIVKEIADWLISQNCLIFVLCPKFEDISESEYETEQWYQTKYVMSKIF